MTGLGSSRVFRFAGWLLTLIALCFLVLVAIDLRSDIAAITISPRQWLAVGGLALVYGASLFLLAGAWHCLLCFLGADQGRPGRSIYAFSTSQLAKFVPGNIFHVVGRHLIHRSDGVPHGKLVVASGIEIALMVLGAGIVVVAAVLLEPPRYLAAIAASLGPYLIAALVLVAMAVLAVSRRYGKDRLPWLLLSLLAYMCFFATMGAIVAMLVSLLHEGVSPAFVGGAGVAAWLVGFATPGAPAGLGTREAAMVFLAGDVVPPAALMVAVALFASSP